MAILVTGAAGFIGFHVTAALLSRGENVIGIDNLNDYYDVSLKKDRLEELGRVDGDRFHFEKVSVEDSAALDRIFEANAVTAVIHLAAQAGVRYSLENPRAYVDSNVVGFINVLESCRRSAIAHLVYASSSSVYGNSENVPYAVTDNVDHPISIYAATKKANELMAHTYSHLYQLPTTGLRFFTVYGPWGRPDMSPFIFARAIFAGEPIRLFNNGNHKRDFTYVDDVVDGVLRVLDRPPAETSRHYALHNIGNHQSVALRDYVSLFEEAIGRKARIELAPLQPGDVESTLADISTMQEGFGYQPATPVEVGVRKFVDWYKDYYNLM